MSASRMKKKETHCSSILNDVLHVALAVGLLGRVGTVCSKFRILSDLERETLAVGDVPMEGVNLDPTHRVERPEQVRDREAV
jgi:hypothetical protein